MSYVINGRLNPAIYNKGAYDGDPVDAGRGISITRQTGYIEVNKVVNILDEQVVLDAYSGACTQVELNLARYNLSTDNEFVSNILIRDTAWNSTLYHAKCTGTSIFINIPLQNSIANAKSFTYNLNIFVQYKLASSYTETVLKNRPLNHLDQTGSEWLYNEWLKTVNLFNVEASSVESNITKTESGFSFINESVTSGAPVTLGLVKDVFPYLEANKTYILTCEASNQNLNELYLYGSGTDWVFSNKS